MLLLTTCQHIYSNSTSRISWFLLNNKLCENVVTDLAIHFDRDILPGLVSNIASNASSYTINRFERKISGKELWEQEKDLLCSFQMKI